MEVYQHINGDNRIRISPFAIQNELMKQTLNINSADLKRDSRHYVSPDVRTQYQV